MADVEISRTFCWLQTLTSVPHLCLSPKQLLPKLGRLQPGASQLRSPVNPPGKQLTGTQTAKQMMDPTTRIKHDRGEVRLQEWPPLNLRTRGRCSQLPQLCVCVCVCAHLCVWCLHGDKLVFWGELFTPVTASIWSRSISLVIGCNISF